MIAVCSVVLLCSTRPSEDKVTLYGLKDLQPGLDVCERITDKHLQDDEELTYNPSYVHGYPLSLHDELNTLKLSNNSRFTGCCIENTSDVKTLLC